MALLQHYTSFSIGKNEIYTLQLEQITRVEIAYLMIIARAEI